MNLTIDVIGVGRQGDNKIFIQETLTLFRKVFFYKFNEFKKIFKLLYSGPFMERRCQFCS